MALKTYNPTTPGQRQLVMVDRSALYKGKPVKTLTEGKQSSGGRKNTRRMAARFRGGAHKKTYTIRGFQGTKMNMPPTGGRLGYNPKTTPLNAPGKNNHVTQAH